MQEAKDKNEQDQGAADSSLLLRIFFIFGSCGLLLAMATDAVAVLGRHTGFTLLGSIEIIQCAILVLAASSMVYASQSDRHARIRILTDRVSEPARRRLQTVADLLSVVFLILLAVGCIWVTFETWPGHERSELLHLPFRWLRLLLALSVILMAAYFTKRLVGGPRA